MIEIPFIRSEDYDIEVVRRITFGDKIETREDKATIVEEDGDAPDKIKFKSDGATMPKPGHDKFARISKKGPLDKLLGKENIKPFLEVHQTSDDKFNAVSFDSTESNLQEAQMDKIYENYRNIRNKRTIQAWDSGFDMHKMSMAYHTALAIIVLGGMWVLVNGLESSIVEGVKAGVSSAQSAGGAAGGVGGP